MEKYTIEIRSEDRISEFDETSFTIKIGNVLPSNKKVFKCSVMNFMIDSTVIEPPEPGEMDILYGIHPDGHYQIETISLTANFPFINYYTTAGKDQCIALYNFNKREMSLPFEFLIGNINQQEINFRLLTLDGKPTVFNQEPLINHVSSIILNLEPVQ